MKSRIILIISVALMMLSLSEKIFAQGEWQYYNNNNQYGVRYIIEDRQNNMWFGTWDLIKFDGHNWTHIDQPADGSLFEDSNGNIWSSSFNSNNIYKYDGTITTVYDLDFVGLYAAINAINEDTVNTIWAATDAGLLYLNGNTWEQVNLPWPYYEYPFDCITRDSSGNMWFGGMANTVLKYDYNSWTIYDSIMPGTFFTNGIGKIFKDSHNNLWFLTTIGICVYDGIDWQIFDNCAGNLYKDMCEDKDGNYWFCSRGAGVYKFDGIKWSWYNSDGGNAFDVSTIDHNNNIWFGSESVGTDISRLKIINIQADNYDCNGLDSTVIKINSPSLMPPLQYSVDSGLTFRDDSIFANLPLGIYQIAVKNNTDTIYNSTATVLDHINHLITCKYKGIITPMRAYGNNCDSLTIDTCEWIRLIAESGFNTYLWSNGSTCLETDVYSSTLGLTTYYLTVTNDLCEYTDSIKVTYTKCWTEINNETGNTSVSISPNPSAGIITIKFENELHYPIKINIYTIQGCFMRSTNLWSTQNTLDISSLPKGIYYIQFFIKDGIITKKILII